MQKETKRRPSQGSRRRVGMAIQMTDAQIRFLEKLAEQNGLFCKHGGASGKPSVSSMVIHIMESTLPNFPVYQKEGTENGTA